MSTSVVTRKLALADIADLRAYERERDDFRTRVIELKRRRRVPLGPFISVVFENRETIRFQVQEMARVEKLMTDHAIQIELDTYNALVPEPGQLCASLFIELTSDEGMNEWLPRLVGIEHALAIRLADGTLVRAIPEEAHAAQLTRTDVTSAVHYYRFEFGADEVAGLADGDACLILDHPACLEQTEFAPHTTRELLNDLTV